MTEQSFPEMTLAHEAGRRDAEKQLSTDAQPPLEPGALAELRAVSLHQWWAALAWLGLKRIETRSWSTPYRGWLAIQSAKKIPLYARDFYGQCPTARQFLSTYYSVHRVEELNSLPLQCIGAIVNLTECQKVLTSNPMDIKIDARYKTEGWQEFGNYERGRYLWLLDNVRRLKEPVPCRGYQGVWTLDAETIAKVEAQL